MPTVTVLITDIGSKNDNKRKACYSAGRGIPPWASVDRDGNINLNKNGNGQPNVDLKFTLPDDKDFHFSSHGPFSVDPSDTGQFSVTSGGGTKELVVADANNDAQQTDYTYQLKLSDDSTLDPKVINH